VKARFSLLLAIGLLGCSGDATSPITFGAFGPLSGDAGRGSFRFGVATAATQIEDDNPHTDWYLWTQPVASGGLQIDDAALAHYRDELAALRAMGIHPVVTLHHFSNPVWIADPRDIGCQTGPSDANLCGLGSPGGAAVIAQMAEHAALIAQRFGEGWIDGIHDVLVAFHARYPDLRWSSARPASRPTSASGAPRTSCASSRRSPGRATRASTSAATTTGA
jgi:hypothetical protein